MTYSSKKAFLATGLFVLAGIVSLILQYRLTTFSLTNSLPLIVFYFVLCINTFCSIKFFSEIIPKNIKSQLLIDIVLVIMYFLIALFITHIKMFLFLTALMFAVAIFKYVLVLDYDRVLVLKKKIIIDNLGAVYMLVAFFVAMFANTLYSAWVCTIGFVLANIYLLLINPMYKITPEK